MSKTLILNRKAGLPKREPTGKTAVFTQKPSPDQRKKRGAKYAKVGDIYKA